MRRVCSISIPVEKADAQQTLQQVRSMLDGVADVKLVKNTKYSRDSNYVIRINCDTNEFNKHIDKFKEIKQIFQQATVRVEKKQEGGGWSNTGGATVIAMMDGRKPEAVATGHFCNRTHAIYWLNEGFEIDVSYWNKAKYKWDGTIMYFKVDFTGYAEKKVGSFRANSIDDIELEIEEPELLRNAEKLMPAIKAAMKKAVCYHCRSEHDW